MAEYIDVSELLNAIDKRNGRLPLWLDEILMEDCHAVDVRPERHGRWVWADDGYLRCSECTQKAMWVQPYEDEPMQEETNYCQYCGAKMDGKDE